MVANRGERLSHIVGDGLNRLVTAREASSIRADVLIGNTRVVEVTSNHPVLDRIELELDYIANLRFCLAWCELVAGLEGSYQ